ncbi:hypothetical protein [Sphingobacterium sp. IITKGP-BTPF85]|uniref:hypothetical protein n=1 Tax=Sphingobacterium sp. IITKGP-BTPF85 TaxID=1338009 RepID=UPI00038A32C8|nr:hypothetical protein [Sphingobacterium sp. IITKGP-BTPF85]KKX46385.1 hypothetical protein L950_0232365 [Sphingobacterium sp. IITKGP-BTPF85]
MTEFEKHADLALRLNLKNEEFDAQLCMGKADDCLRDNPNQIAEISDFSIVGNLYARMVFYGWKSSRIANLAYWGLSKSLINSQKNIDLITTRLLVMIFAR